MENSIALAKDWRVKIGMLAMALAIISAAVVVRPARADEHEHYDHRAHEQRHYRHPPKHHRRVIYAPPDVYYAPPPIVYAPPRPPGGFTFIFPFWIR